MTSDPPAPAADQPEPVADTPTPHPWRRRGLRALRVAAVVLVAVVGGSVGWALAPGSTATVGPLTVAVDVDLSTEPGASLELPPIGEVAFDTHRGVVAVRASVVAVDVDEAQSLISSPQALADLTASAPAVLGRAVALAGTFSVGCALLGAALAGGLVYRSRRSAGRSAGVLMAPVVVVGLLAAVTFDPAALAAPRFTGLLSQAPYLAGQGQTALQRLESYRSGIADVVRSVTTLYTLTDSLPVLPRGGAVTTVLHVSDIHLNPQGFDLTAQLVEQFGVDVVADTGDITTWGTAAESATLAPIGRLGVPYLFVRGNHDSELTAEAVAEQPNAVVLDGTTTEVAGLVFAGIGDGRFSADSGGDEGESAREVAGRTADRLAQLVQATNRQGDDVDVAMIHDPSRLDALFGEVPLVLSGHYHARDVRVDADSGTRVMVEGSTGGAGVTANGFRSLSEGDPVPLEASLLYFASAGDREGQLVAYDEVTVGGLGLSSVTIDRTVVPDPATADEPSESPSDPAVDPDEVPSTEP